MVKKAKEVYFIVTSEIPAVISGFETYRFVNPSNSRTHQALDMSKKSFEGWRA